MSIRTANPRVVTVLVSLIGLICVPLVRADDQQTLILTSSTKEVLVRPYVEVIPDSLRTDTIQSVRDKRSSGRFVSFEQVHRSLKSAGRRYWFRLFVHNESDNSEWVFAFLPTSQATTAVYLPDGRGRYTRQATSANDPFAKRAIEHRYIVYPMDIPPGTEQTIYLHMATQQNFSMGIWSYTGFLKHSRDDELLLGLFYGIAVAIALYNLFLFVALRDVSYLLYTLFVCFFSLLLAYWDGTALEYLNASHVAGAENVSQDLFANLTAASAFLFVWGFLNAKRYSKVLDRILLGFVACYVTLALLFLLLHLQVFTVVSNVVSVPGLVMFFVSIGFVLRQGFRPARYLLAGMVPALVTAVLLGLNNLGIPLDLAIVLPIGYISFVIALVLFSFALARRISLVHRQKEVSEQVNRAKTEFFVDLSHEVKTPLTVISNYLDSYMREHDCSEDLMVMRRAVDKLSRDMTQFFDVLRFEKGIDAFAECVEVNLSEIVGERVALFGKLCDGHGLTLRSQIEEGLAVTADPAALDRVVDNLLENAVKYNRSGGAIDVVLHRRGNCVALTVSDTGIGIAQEDLNEIFKPYYQVSMHKGNRQGIGMGLHLVKRIVDSLNGQISVNSVSGAGSTFTVELACDDPGAIGKTGNRERGVKSFPVFGSIAATRESIPAGGLRPLDPSRPTVLVVEDSTDLLDLMVRVLSSRYNVLSASNGVEAISKLRTAGSCSLLVTDVMMDQMDGYELLERLQSEAPYENIPCIFISAKSTLEERLLGLEKGAIDYIYKPFSLDELVGKVDSLTRHEDLAKARHHREQLATLRALVSGFAHEIRNPLSGITGPIDNLKKLLGQKAMFENPQLAKHFQFLTESVQRIQDVTTALQTLAGERRFEHRRLRMDDITRSVLNAVRQTAPRGIRFDADVDRCAEIHGDRRAAELILRNLVSNAVDAIGNDGEVFVSVVHSEAGDRISVKDTGAGMAPEVKERIFDAFYTSKEPGLGMGVGLFLVKEACMGMGWEILVDSTPGEGSEIILWPRRGDSNPPRQESITS